MIDSSEVMWHSQPIRELDCWSRPEHSLIQPCFSSNIHWLQKIQKQIEKSAPIKITSTIFPTHPYYWQPPSCNTQLAFRVLISDLLARNWYGIAQNTTVEPCNTHHYSWTPALVKLPYWFYLWPAIAAHKKSSINSVRLIGSVMCENCLVALHDIIPYEVELV